MQELTIDPEFEKLLPPLDPDSLEALDASIESEGPRDPIIVWANHNNTILDGHNRYKLCLKHEKPFRTIAYTFESRAEALDWIWANQKGRRNMTPEAMKLIRGAMYEAEKAVAPGAQAGNKHASKNIGDKVTPMNSGGSASERVAKKTGVSAKTVKRDAQFKAAFDKVAQFARDKIAANGLKASTADLKALAKLDGPTQRAVVDGVASGGYKSIRAFLKKHGEQAKPKEPPKMTGGIHFDSAECEAANEYYAAQEPSAEESPRDDWGIPIQPHAAEAFEAAPLFDEVLKLLRKADRLYSQIAARPGGEYLRRPGVSIHRNDRWKHLGLKNAILAVTDAKPTYTVCPFEYHAQAFPESNHKHDEKCQLCAGLNWSRQLGKEEIDAKVIAVIKEAFSVPAV